MEASMANQRPSRQRENHHKPKAIIQCSAGVHSVRGEAKLHENTVMDIIATGLMLSAPGDAQISLPHPRTLVWAIWAEPDTEAALSAISLSKTMGDGNPTGLGVAKN